MISLSEKTNGSCLVRTVSGAMMPPFDGWKRPHSIMGSKKIAYKKKRRSIFKAVWPHILLIIILAIYIVCGAIAFLYLEHPTEVRLKSEGLLMIEKQKLRLQRFVWSSLVADSLSATNATNATSINSTSSDSLSLLESISDNGTLSNKSETESDTELRWRSQFDQALTDYTRVLLRAMRDNFIEHSILFDDDTKNDDLWTLPAAVLFAFSAVTTIGYGNIAPVTFKGRLFCIFYGLIGIPFAMLVLANVGKFLSEGLRHVVAFCHSTRNRLTQKIRPYFQCRKSKSKLECDNNNADRCSTSQSHESDDDKEIDQPLPFVCLIGLVFGYICLGAVLLPAWESFSFFDAFYFNFVTITTTGFGDLVPQRFNFLAVTLIYVAVGIAMTTMCIEAAAAYMRKLHYVGRRIQGAKFTRIRFGDKMITVDELITSLGVKFNVPTLEVAKLKTKLDAFVATAIETRHLDEEKKVQALADFDSHNDADHCYPNGGALSPIGNDDDEDTWTLGSIFLPELTAPLRRLLGAFNVSDEDIRFIDDERIETAV